MPENQKILPDISTSKTFRSFGEGLSIELLQVLGRNDLPHLLAIAQSVADIYHLRILATKDDILKYFNYPDTIPFVVRRGDTPVGFIVGAELENFSHEEWAETDSMLGESNTIYTYAFALGKAWHGSGIGDDLKSTYLWWCRNKGYKYVSGCVREGQTGKMRGEPEVLAILENWNGTGLTFEYYRRKL